MTSRLSPAARPAAAVVALAAGASAVLAPAVVGTAPAARAAAIPQFLFATSSATHAVSAADPAESSGINFLDGANPPLDYSNTLTFAGGGRTVARTGLARRADANSVRITFAPGTGVSQTDPGRTRGPSTLQVNFEARWQITAGQFGPPVLTGFSVPIGLNIGAGGSGGFSAAVRWETNFADDPAVQAREPFVVNVPFGPGKYLTTVSAPPRPFTYPTLGDNDPMSPAFIRMYGNIVFAVDNEDAPSLIEFPTAENFGDLPDFNQYTFEPGLTTSEFVVPEPATAGALGAAAVGLLAARRRRRRRPVGLTA